MLTRDADISGQIRSSRWRDLNYSNPQPADGPAMDKNNPCVEFICKASGHQIWY